MPGRRRVEWLRVSCSVWSKGRLSVRRGVGGGNVGGMRDVKRAGCVVKMHWAMVGWH